MLGLVRVAEIAGIAPEVALLTVPFLFRNRQKAMALLGKALAERCGFAPQHVVVLTDCEGRRVYIGNAVSVIVVDIGDQSS